MVLGPIFLFLTLGLGVRCLSRSLLGDTTVDASAWSSRGRVTRCPGGRVQQTCALGVLL